MDKTTGPALQNTKEFRPGSSGRNEVGILFDPHLNAVGTLAVGSSGGVKVLIFAAQVVSMPR
ncbi:hypothetical protein [Streptosporangium subroseum]|uniref:hypothetical protein n=1 Tax=Streptosporangium subroseum TaxID=106412 RepID=UPI00117FB62D|nr:hypothetical protein [Streptosporangium subroseum]